MIQVVLVDLLATRQDTADMREILSSATDDINKLKELGLEKADSQAKKLDTICDYLVQAFDNKLDIVLHKAQV